MVPLPIRSGIRMSFSKIGSGLSTRSHSANEFIFVHEIEEAINIYIELLGKYFNDENLAKNQALDRKIDHFTVGKDREYDLYLAAYDCQASIAHAQMLAKTGVMTEEADQLIGVLNDLKSKAEKGNFVIEAEFEDIHSKIEYVLIQKLGDLGKKIHTARSRNDQVLVALHLYLKEEIKTIKGLTLNFLIY